MDIIRYALECMLNTIIGLGMTLFLLFMVLLLATAINNIGKSKKHLSASNIGAAMRDLAEHGVCYVDTITHARDIMKASPVKVKIEQCGKTYRVMEVK